MFYIKSNSENLYLSTQPVLHDEVIVTLDLEEALSFSRECDATFCLSVMELYDIFTVVEIK